jgi:hypothetical protein
MEHGSPLRAEVLRREHVHARHVLYQGAKRLLTVVRIEQNRHETLSGSVVIGCWGRPILPEDVRIGGVGLAAGDGELVKW